MMRGAMSGRGSAGGRPLRWLGVGLAILVLVVLPVLYGAVMLWAHISVDRLFFDSLDMGGAYSTVIRSYLALLAAGALVALVMAAPFVPVGRRVVGMPGPRLIAWGAAAGVFLLGCLVMIPALTGNRNAILAALNTASFEAADPVFGRDASFFIFIVPVVLTLLWSLAGLAFIATATSVALLVVGIRARRQSDIIPGIANIGPLQLTVLATRGLTLALAYGGATLALIGAALWWTRYTLISGGSELIAGPGEAMRAVGIPTQTVASAVMMLGGVGIAALAVPALRRRVEAMPAMVWARVAVIGWGVIVALLVVLATPWWLVLLVPVLILWRVLQVGTARVPEMARVLRRPVASWALAAGVVATALVGLFFAPAGTALYDAMALRGSPLQVERDQIEATLMATRTAAGIDEIEETDAQYRRGGVTREAVENAEASVRSLRFLDYGPALNACRRMQALNRYYTCGDADLDRYSQGGDPQTMFVFGREVDYGAIPDFQRRHFAFTHGNGVVMAPVNRIESSGRPDFVVSGLPVTGLPQPLQHPEIYFGAQENMPWSVVNTTQPDGFTNRPAKPWEGAGIPVRGNRLAITLSLGGLPYVGGGRRVWNALDRVETTESRLLLHRDLTSRVAKLAPFLVPDADPYFVVAERGLWVMMNAYTMTDAYPYAAAFGGRNYQRHAVTAVMNATTGETHLYVMDSDDPIVRTWRDVYPSLFSDRDEMPASLAAHLRYGEDIFEYQAAALGRFHVTDVDRFFNNDDAWAPTVETAGTGAEGTRIISPARFTYARLPDADAERFLLVRYFKPATTGRGIGFSAWLAADSDPERFGRLSVLRFTPDGPSPLDSVDTFASNVGRDPGLSAEIGVRRDQVLRGNTIVVPVGQGLLYVQPLYLDTAADSLPSLWRVVVSFGDGRIFYDATFERALAAALGGQVSGDGGDGEALPTDLRQLVRRAAAAYEAYRVAWNSGDYTTAARELTRFERLMERANQRAQAAEADPAG